VCHLEQSQGSTLPKVGLPRATAFRFGQGHFEAVFNFYFNSRQEQKQARPIHALERVAIWGCDMTLGTHPAASKVRQKP